jgi:hypothetical protein
LEKENVMKTRWMILIAIVAIATIAIGTIGAGAWFTDSATSNVATISSGTLSIADGQVSETVIGVITNMAPGDETGIATITIVNDGTMNLAWFGNLIVSDSILKNVVFIKDAEMKFLSPTNQNWQPLEGTCPAGPDHFITLGLGTGCWPTVWGGPDHLATLAVFDNNPNMAPGTPYEFMGALKPGYKYQLTLQFGFWDNAGDAYQGQGPMTIHLKVDATQIKFGALEALYPSLGNMLDWMNTQIGKQMVP